MAIKMYSQSQSQWVDYNEELVNETVGTIYVNNRWKIAWKGLHAHNGVRFTRWTSTNSLPSTAGNYVLMNDVSLANAWTVPTGTTNLCLNGFKISVASTKDNAIILNSASAILNIRDCNYAHRTNTFTSATGYGQITVESGLITGAKRSAIYITAGRLNLYGGTIGGINNDSTNTADGRGAGVRLANSGQFYMYGGRIAHNYVFAHGGAGVGVANSSKMYMYGGQIDHCNASFGGAVILTETAEFYMYDGIMNYNKATNSNPLSPLPEGGAGGGAIILGGTHNKINGVKLFGGELSNNYAETQGGAIAFDKRNSGNKSNILIANVLMKDNTAKSRGGAIGTGNANPNCILVKGSPKIKENYLSGGSIDNIFLYNTTNNVINVVDKLEEADIGVNMQSPGVFTKNYSTYNTEEPNTFFSSDNASYEVVLASGEAKLQAK